MPNARPLVFYHAPNSRSSGVLTLFEELGAPYELRLIDFKTSQQREPAYLAVNPMGKVPAILDGDTLVAEQAAIYIHLADRFPEAGLAPTITDPTRGSYLRWLVFYNGSFEPAVVDLAMNRDPARRAMCPYGDYDTMLGTLIAQLENHDFIAGDAFTAADILWASALKWTTGFRLIPDVTPIRAYIDRITARPSFARAAAKDEALARQLGEAA